jgi:hypothetical protein
MKPESKQWNQQWQQLDPVNNGLFINTTHLDFVTANNIIGPQCITFPAPLANADPAYAGNAIISKNMMIGNQITLRKLTWFFSFRDSEPNIKLLSKMLKTQIP